jgi:hypothetical protein
VLTSYVAILMGCFAAILALKTRLLVDANRVFEGFRLRKGPIGVIYAAAIF